MRAATWNEIGTDVKNARNVDTVLEQANLNYTVRKRPSKRYNSITRRNEPYPEYVSRRFHTERVSDGHVYEAGLTESYTVIQNRDAFDFVNYIADDIRFEKAGETENGLVYVIGRLPDVNILGDGFTPHVIFTNGFGGNSSVRAAICPLRIICQNQFATAFGDTNNSISIRHTKGAVARMKEAKKTLITAADYMEQLRKMAEGYAAMKIGPRQLGLVIDAMFPEKEGMAEEKLKALAKKKAKFEAELMAAMQQPDNYMFRGTAWGLVNAYTDMLTHAPVKGRSSAESRFEKVTFGNDAARFMRIVDKIAV